MVEFPELTLVSLPGYHDPNYITCKTGCQYLKSTVAEVVRVAKESKVPVTLVAHGPPHGNGNPAHFAGAGGNVGDEAITRAIREGNIAFGLFSNIMKPEGGPRKILRAPSWPRRAKSPSRSSSTQARPTPWDGP